MAQPVGVGGDLGGGVEALEQFGDGSSSARPIRSAAAKRPEPPSSTTTRSLPGPGKPQPCGRSSKQQSNERLAALLAKQHYRQDRLTTVRTTSAWLAICSGGINLKLHATAREGGGLAAEDLEQGLGGTGWVALSRCDGLQATVNRAWG